MRARSDGPVTAGDLLTLEELGHFRRTSTRRGVCLVLHAWGVIAGAIALYLLWPSGLTLGLAVLVIGTRQLGLMVLMHETAHGLLFRQGRLNTSVGTWLCAGPLGADLKAIGDGIICTTGLRRPRRIPIWRSRSRCRSRAAAWPWRS